MKSLTTGMVAKLCGVAPRTATRWIDDGLLNGYRLPGSKDRRVTPVDLVDFCRKENIPIPTNENIDAILTKTPISDEESVTGV